MSKFNPGTNRVLVKPAEPETRMGKAGLILVTEWRQHLPNYGTIVAVGKLEGQYAEYPNPLKAGQYAIWHPKWKEMKIGTEIEIEGIVHILLHAENVFGTQPKVPVTEELYDASKTTVA